MSDAARCAAGNVATRCCVGDPWANITATDVMCHGEPLDLAVITNAAATGVDPHELDWHVTAVCGWESHDFGYAAHVTAIARDLRDDGCEVPDCRFGGWK
ncbi:hypothetical protein [Micromonospora sp. NPDC005174]|uniref:hypothetical protein n=1 Tax=Micromonospora sp. NPDC005174 TaxID=3157018 RepID=UPI0033B83765